VSKIKVFNFNTKNLLEQLNVSLNTGTKKKKAFWQIIRFMTL